MSTSSTRHGIRRSMVMNMDKVLHCLSAYSILVYEGTCPLLTMDVGSQVFTQICPENILKNSMWGFLLHQHNRMKLSFSIRVFNL
jgi:hypothetical protein